MKEQGIEITKEILEETAPEEDVENESFSISLIEEFYKPEILKTLDRVLVLSENITKIKKNKNITKISDANSLKNLNKYQNEILNYFNEIKILKKITSYSFADLTSLANEEKIDLYQDGTKKKKTKQMLYDDLKKIYE